MQVEIEEALDGAVGGYDAGGDGGVLRLELDFGPIFVARTFDAAADGNGETAVRSGIFGVRAESELGDLLGGERIEFLAIVLIDAESEADAVEADLYGFVGFVAEGDLDGDESGGERGFLGEGLFVLRRIEKASGGDSHAFVGFRGGGFGGWRLLGERKGACCCGCEAGDGESSCENCRLDWQGA